MLRVIIADDHPVLRSGIRAVLESAPDISVISEVDRAADAVTAAAELTPDLVTMDLRFPDGDSGVTAITQLVALNPAPAVLVLTNYDTDTDILGAIEAGARGYLLKDSAPAEILAAVRKAASGQSVLAPQVADKLLQRMREPKVQLTGRETDMLTALNRGLSNKEIGAELFLGETTVKTHLARLYAKLGVTSRTAALAKARDLGLITP